MAADKKPSPNRIWTHNLSVIRHVLCRCSNTNVLYYVKKKSAGLGAFHYFVKFEKGGNIENFKDKWKLFFPHKDAAASGETKSNHWTVLPRWPPPIIVCNKKVKRISHWTKWFLKFCNLAKSDPQGRGFESRWVLGFFLIFSVLSAEVPPGGATLTNNFTIKICLAVQLKAKQA